MKRIAFTIITALLAATMYAQQEPVSKDSFFALSPVEVKAVRAADNAPFTKTNLTRQDIAKQNLGQDIPFLLNQTPAVVVNSDAGTGIGYTGIRIRGTDATRINVTLNGIPYNDAESQGTFFVDLPDFASSTGSIQVQRGVGTSSNGTGSFGGSINISTNDINRDAYAEINNSAGSFNTFKTTLKTGSGLVDGHFTADLRWSSIQSDGYIDRASSNLQSWYFSSAYIGKKNSLRLNLFSGKEKTYQAWDGVSEADLLAGNRTINYEGTEKPGTPYDNQVDDYKQDHYQLFFNQQLGKRLSFNTALFLTEGRGYYEQYKADQDYADYNLPQPGSSSSTDLVRQLWLDNDYYGTIYSLQYHNKASQFTLGGGLTRYNGRHFGEVIWAEQGLTGLNDWYHHTSRKTDANIYFKQQTRLSRKWTLFYDLQYRQVRYNINGFRETPDLLVRNNYHFFNPKAGISFANNGWRSYLSYGQSGKEPNRDDFEAGLTQQPTPEYLHDVEAAIERTGRNWNWGVTFYYMHYKDQLVLTGKINDVGAYTRTNIPKSYRAGIELQGGWQLAKWFNATGNVAFSRNKVRNFNEYIDDYDNGGQIHNQYQNSDIALSPSVVGAASLNFLPLPALELSLPAKYVSRQYLDNTQQTGRSIAAFYVQDFRASYHFRIKWLKEITLVGQVLNVWDKKYEPSGYTYSYLYGGQLTTENYYFPMAGRNYLVALNIRL